MMKLLMLSCKEATRLTEQKIFEGKLSRVKAWQLSMHLKMCDACKRYSQQSAMVEKAFRERLESTGDETVLHSEVELPGLSPEKKDAILKRLESHL
ncbi:MAG: hypothetical protein Q7T20_07550 [Saprospiraceae bacterium]|nr:hypothetical protein [Saprospiraceae bacterium]